MTDVSSFYIVCLYMCVLAMLLSLCFTLFFAFCVQIHNTINKILGDLLVISLIFILVTLFKKTLPFLLGSGGPKIKFNKRTIDAKIIQ